MHITIIFNCTITILIQNNTLPVPQGKMLQGAVSEPAPWHVNPPLEGAGLLQSLVRT